MAEAGVPDFEMSSWQAVYAPKGTPKPIVDKLNAEIVKILKTPDVQREDAGHDGHGDRRRARPRSSPTLMQREIPRWAELVRKSGATARTESRRRTSWNSPPRRWSSLRKVSIATLCTQLFKRGFRNVYIQGIGG